MANTADPRFIVIGDDLQLSLTPDPPRWNLAVQLGDESEYVQLRTPNGSQDLYQLLCNTLSIFASEDYYERTGRKACASIAPPDPWMIALSLMVWEGVIQGAGWDMVKLSLQRALGLMQTKGVAPQVQTKRTRFAMYLEAGNWFRIHACYERFFRTGEGTYASNPVEPANATRNLPAPRKPAKKRSTKKRTSKKPAKKRTGKTSK